MCDSAEAYINIVLNNFQNSFHLPLCFIYIESQLPTKRQQYSHAHSQCNLFHDRKPLFFVVVAFITSYIHYKMEKSIFLGYYYYFYRISAKWLGSCVYFVCLKLATVGHVKAMLSHTFHHVVLFISLVESFSFLLLKFAMRLTFFGGFKCKSLSMDDWWV
jgi:hypothetical protein